MPIATWKSRLRSGNAHCDLQLAVEVRQCPLGSGARGGGPAVPTGIWTARRRRRVRRRRRRRALLKSSNPHLAGEEQAPFLGQTGSVFGKNTLRLWEETVSVFGKNKLRFWKLVPFWGKTGSVWGKIGSVFGLAWDKAQVSLF